MVKNSGLYPVVGVESGQVPAVGLAGARLLTETSGVTGLGNELSQALSTWRRPGSVHDPGKIILDLAVCVALGGRCLSDLSPLRCEKEVFGPVASDPTVSRLIGALADHVEAVEAAVNRARTVVRQRVWALAGADAPTAGVSANRPLVIDVDATLVNVHSEKEGAAPTFKKGFGYHPLTAWFDHGPDGGGECAVIVLRPGNAGSNTAADHVEIIRRALDQAGLGPRPGRKVLVRIDGAGGTKETIELLARRRVSYSVGFTLPDHTPQIYDTIPEAAWAPAYNADGQPRQGADVAEITDLLDLTAWPKGMRVIMRRERPHQGAQLRFEDVGGLPADCLRHQHEGGAARRSRGAPPAASPLPGDRIRCAKDTGLDRFPLQGFDQNRIWCLIVALARRPAGLLPAARPGRRPRPHLGAQDDPPAPDEHPRSHHPPCPPHRPALQGRPPLHRPPADRTEQLSGPTRTIGTRPLPPAHHDPEGTTLWPPERPDHRETTRGRPSHPTGIIAPTTPATTPPTPHSTNQ